MAGQTWFKAELKKMKDFSVLEIGTRRWIPQFPTHHKDWDWFTGYREFIMSDFMEGEDVDVVADVHELSKTFGENRFDVIFLPSVFEHLDRPWIAATEILKVLSPGGIFMVQTHQTFPIHGYPNDYFRYTTSGLLSLFAGASEKYGNYEFPCEIHSEECGIQKNAFLNVVVAGRK